MRLIIIPLALMVAFCCQAAWVKVVYDKKTHAIVLANAASQKVVEDEHNQQLDSIAARQQKIEGYSVSMATMKELYKLSMTNIKGFGQESRYYKEIGQLALEILTSLPRLYSEFEKAGVASKTMTMMKITDLTLRTQTLVGDFVNIVNNAQVKNPLGNMATVKKSSDGYNFINRHERVGVAMRIYSDLYEIKMEINVMSAYARFGSKEELFRTIAPMDWMNVISSRVMVDNLVSDWKGL